MTKTEGYLSKAEEKRLAKVAAKHGIYTADEYFGKQQKKAKSKARSGVQFFSVKHFPHTFHPSMCG